MTFKFSQIYFIFTTNNDVQALLVFGHNIDTWLIYVLIFFGLTSIAFVFVWFLGFLGERKSKDYSHGCFTDFPDCISVKNPIIHTKTKVNDVKPKKIST